jgi:hypothetical protein
MRDELLRMKTAMILAKAVGCTIEEAEKKLNALDEEIRSDKDADKRVCKIS